MLQESMHRLKPAVLVFAAHDPSGGAGIQADIETLAAHGCIAMPVITALTAQNTRSFAYHLPQDGENFISQVRLVINDIDIAACRIGAIGSLRLIEVIHEVISTAVFPVILDPVLQSTTGYDFADRSMGKLICELLIPYTKVLTPNRHEALLLTERSNVEEAAASLLDMGCENVLITDIHPSATEIHHRLYRQDGTQETYVWERLVGNYHGSGCTLAAAISAGLAKKIELTTAVVQAQEFTWESLRHGLEIGKGQFLPNRFFRQ